MRAAAYWKLREALDPSSPQPLALPPSRDLRVQLCAPRYGVHAGGVALEKKDKVKERLGRSPDLADAVVMAFWDDPRSRYGQHVGKSARWGLSGAPEARVVRR